MTLTDAIPAASAAKLVPAATKTGHVSPSTITRWIHDGILIRGERIRLAASRIGGRLFVTSKNLDEFIQSCSGDMAVSQPSPAEPN